MQSKEEVHAVVDKEYAIEKVLAAFDMSDDGKITEDEFIERCKKWINEAKQLSQNGDSTSRRYLHKEVQSWIEKKRHEFTKIELLMARIMKHVHHQTFEPECLLTDDERPNLDRIKSLFKRYDFDGSNSISKHELKELILMINFGDVQLDQDVVVEKVMTDFDVDGDSEINEEEFIHGFTKWLSKATLAARCPDPKRSIDEFDKIMWKEVDSLVYEVKQNGRMNYKLLTWPFNKSVFKVILGIAILTFLAGPLIVSIQQLTDALGVPSFFISFVILPIALNARMAISAIFPASQKTIKTASLTFSEIYGGVVMNNIMSLTTLLSIVYAKDLTWGYSAQVLIVLVVCAIIGLLAVLSSTYPLWTSFLAFFLYPFSLFLFYVFQFVWGWN